MANDSRTGGDQPLVFVVREVLSVVDGGSTLAVTLARPDGPNITLMMPAQTVDQLLQKLAATHAARRPQSGKRH